MNFQLCQACGQHYWMTDPHCPHCKATSQSKWLKGSTNAAVTLLLGLGVVGCNNETTKDSAQVIEPSGEPEYGVPAVPIDTAGDALYGVPDSGGISDTADSPLYGVPDVDNDGDGFSMDIDCDDDDLNTYPGAAELDSSSNCMTDADGDGYGNSTPSNPNVSPGTDCDDSNPDIFPGQGC